jgi:hypothetical protein
MLKYNRRAARARRRHEHFRFSHSLVKEQLPCEGFYIKSNLFSFFLIRFNQKQLFPCPLKSRWTSTVKGKPGIRLQLQVDFYQGKKHLPIVTLKRAS